MQELEGKNPLNLDSRPPKQPVEEYMNMENRFKMLTKSKPDVAKALHEAAQANIEERWATYKYLASRSFDELNGDGASQNGGDGA